MRNFFEQNSGKIISVGDTFDYSRSFLYDETETAYIERTRHIWRHIHTFVYGNHDKKFLERNFSNSLEYYREGEVLAFHGHQFQCKFQRCIINKYEQKFDHKPKHSLFWDIEEKLLETFNSFFIPDEETAKNRALKKLRILEKNAVKMDFNILILGHTHLPYDVKVNYNGKDYRVVNLGSACKNQVCNKAYIESINKWFVSDLHLGTKKSII